ncbi:hypothetical protein C8J56DRAFT_802311, partial [Mycena floridula]
ASDESSIHRFIRWCLVVISVCTIIDIAAIVYLASMTLGVHPVTVDNLPLRSTYIVLEGLYTKNQGISSNEPIINAPRVLQLVDSSDPARVFPQWDKNMTDRNGVLLLEERRFLINRSTSIIAQFRPIDFGMETCVLKFKLPFRYDSSTSRNPAPSSHLENSELEVWSLKQDFRVDTQRLTWNSRPERDQHIGTFLIPYRSTQEMPAFPCRSGGYLTFELACGNLNDCNIDEIVTGDKQNIGQCSLPTRDKSS